VSIAIDELQRLDVRRSNRSKLAHEKQHDQDDQDQADDTDAAVAVAVAAEAATEATNKKIIRTMMSLSPIDMIYLLLCAPNRTLSLFALGL
jgi:hypothetical protein